MTRYHKHTLSCSGPRKESERPQWSPCGGGNDGCGGLGATRRQHQRRGGDDDIRPAAQLARLAATPAIVVPPAPACCTKCSRSDQQRDLLFCDGRLCRKAFLRWAAVVASLDAATLVGRFVGPRCLVSMCSQMAASAATSATTWAAAKASLAVAEEAAAAVAAAPRR